MRRPADIDLDGSLWRRVLAIDEGERDPHAQAWGHRAARDPADRRSTGRDGAPVAGDPPVLHAHADEPRIVVPRPLRLERVAAHERTVPLHEPRAVHLERSLMAVEVLPRQQVALLEPQRVPRPQADRLQAHVGAGAPEGRPDPEPLAGGREELESHLTRVARPRDQERGPSSGNGRVPSGPYGGAVRRPGPPPPDFRWNRTGPGPPRRRRHEVDRGGAERPDCREVDRGEALQQVGRPRALEGDAQEALGAVVERHPGEVRPQPLHYRGTRLRIAHDEEPVRREARHDDIVENRPVVPQQVRVPRPSRRRREGVRAEPVERLVRGIAFDEELAHVADVEQPDGLSDGEVLVHDPGVEQGHLPSAELDEPRAGLPMRFVQRGPECHPPPDGGPRMKAFVPGKAYARSPHSRGPPWGYSASCATS